MSWERPDPEKLLKALEGFGPGRHKIYLGWAPGLGKTHRALLELQDLKAKGVAVAIGWLEAKDRPLLRDLAADIPWLPPHKLPERGPLAEVMDLEAILALRPATVLVDELARANPAGALTRLEEVKTLLAAGISVISTLNALHLESLAPTAGRYLVHPVEVQIPDLVLEQADEVVVVDLPPESLLERLRNLPDYKDDPDLPLLRLSALKALRELTLGRLSQALETRLERILAVAPEDPAAFRRVVDYGAERARRLGGELDVVLFRPPWVNLEERRLAFMERYAASRGARFSQQNALRPGQAALAAAKAMAVAAVIMDSRTGPIAQLLNRPGDYEIHLVSQRPPVASPRPLLTPPSLPQWSSKLKIFLGAAAGVGKTYAMLREAQELKSSGKDVAVALLESHGRRETQALAEGLEVIPRRRIIYKGLTLEEMDLEAVLARKPQIALVDELAHTNAPGSKNQKRYQDVIELLEAGIDVHTTLNIQHLETLNDLLVARTGIRVRETVPDRILLQADQIALVDVPPEVLQQRLQEGKIYAPEQAERATTNFFTRDNLKLLRELTLSRAAEAPKTVPGSGSVLVSVRPRESDAALIRRGARVAERLGDPFYVLCVASEDPTVQSLAQLTQSLGGEFVREERGPWLARLTELAYELKVEQIILGRSRSVRRPTVLRAIPELAAYNLVILPLGS